jgi:steroid delta-isomerase-like uncharacterized protein
MSETNKAIARRVFQVGWNQGELAVVDELIAPDYTNHDPANPGVRGSQGFKQLITAYRAAFPDIHFVVEDQIAEGDRVTTRWTATGTHQGDLRGIPATGKQATVTGITVDRVADGQVQESWANWDTLGMMQQLGVVPAPE